MELENGKLTLETQTHTLLLSHSLFPSLSLSCSHFKLLRKHSNSFDWARCVNRVRCTTHWVTATHASPSPFLFPTFPTYAPVWHRHFGRRFRSFCEQNASKTRKLGLTLHTQKTRRRRQINWAEKVLKGGIQEGKGALERKDKPTTLLLLCESLVSNLSWDFSTTFFRFIASTRLN